MFTTILPELPKNQGMFYVVHKTTRVHAYRFCRSDMREAASGSAPLIARAICDDRVIILAENIAADGAFPGIEAVFCARCANLIHNENEYRAKNGPA